MTACSDDLRRRAPSPWARRRERTRTVPYGVDATAFAPRRTAAACARGWARPPGALLVLAVGRLVEKKGFAHLVEAAAGLAGRSTW